MPNITAAILIIGNEILSGRTQDLNIQYIAKKLSDQGIYLEEVRIIPDSKKVIIQTVHELRSKYTYIFTTGGIGPTHDDITTESIAEAFSLNVVEHPEAYRRITEYYRSHNQEINEPSKKMALIPQGSILIDNNETAAPGFIIENIYVMAGVPYIMQAMIESILPTLTSGDPIHSKTIELLVGESAIAYKMEILQTTYPTVSVGSYPFYHNNLPATAVVLRSNDKHLLDKAFQEFLETVKQYSIVNNINL